MVNKQNTTIVKSLKLTTNKMTSETKYFGTAGNEALKKAGLIFMYVGGSAVLPILLTYLSGDPKWLGLTILINSLWAAFDKYMKVKGLTNKQ